jgi:peptidoglycan/LPS O-acetylase OafA/YrhL
MTGNTPTPEARLGDLDALRGLAALSVVLFHYTWRYTDMVPDGTGLPYGLPWAQHGVEVFFGISGFVIFMTLRRTKTIMDFVVARFARLYPAYWVGIVITTLAVALSGMDELRIPAAAVIINFSMLQGHFSLPHVDGAYWSLGVELGFYATMLVIWRLRLLDRIELVLCAWVMLRLLWWYFPSMPWRLGYFLIVEYVPFFIIGIAGYRVWSGERKWVQQAPLLTLTFFSIIIADKQMFAWVFGVSLIIFALLTADKLKGLRHPVLLWLGSISYTLYLVHQNMGYAIIRSIEGWGGSPWLAVAVALITALGVATAMTRWIEKPTLRMIRAGWARFKTRVEPTPTLTA